MPTDHKKYDDAGLQQKHDALFQQSRMQPLEPVLPPGLKESDFRQVLHVLESIVGRQNLFTGASLIEYIDPFQLDEGNKRNIPSVAVCPKDVEEVRRILAVANEFLVPLWTCSRGKNLGYGGPAPIVSGSIVLDLHRVNRIVEVNDTFSYAVVEPGVTFFDLYNYCRERKLKVWPSVPSLGWGSVLGNTLDRGFGYTPNGDHHQQVCGMEVILANGEVVRTGQFAISNSKAAHLSKLSFGPSIEGLFLQSNLGVVTRLGIWLTPQPQCFISCTLDMDEPEDIVAIINTFRELHQHGILQNNPALRNIVAWSSMNKRRDEIWDGEGAIPHWRLRQLQKESGLGYWMARFGFYGPKDLIEKRLSITKEVLARMAPGSRLKSYLFEGSEGDLVDAASIPTPLGGGQVGVPDMWTLPSVQYRCRPGGDGIGAHTDFSPILPLDGNDVLEWFNTSKQIMEEQGFDLYCGGHIHPRYMILINMMVFDKTNPHQRETVERIFGDLSRKAKKHGISKYRAHINQMDMVADLYDFNQHAYRRFVETLKDTLDPNGILSPGKQGIWPRKYRESSGGHSKL